MSYCPNPGPSTYGSVKETNTSNGDSPSGMSSRPCVLNWYALVGNCLVLLLLGAVLILSRVPESESNIAHISDIPKCPTFDPVISGTEADIPSELLQKYAVIGNPVVKAFEFVDQDTGAIDVTMNFPIANFTRKNLPHLDSAEWCNTKGQQMFRINIQGMCLHDSDPDFYYLKGVLSSQFSSDCTPQILPGECRLVRVSRNISSPRTWTEYSTLTMGNGGAIEWVHDDEHVGMRLKYSLCPNTVDESARKILTATFE